MKRNLFSRKLSKTIIVVFMLGLSVTGCLETTREVPITMTVSAKTLYFPFSGEVQTITIDSNTNAWKLTCDASWITITPSSGAKKATVTIRANANDEPENRSGTITITGTGVEAPLTIPVSIGAAPLLTVSPSTLNFSASDMPKQLTVVSDASWTVSKNVDWLNVAPTSGTNKGTLTVTAINNSSTGQRTATVSVSNPDLAQPRTVNVTQSGVNPNLQVSSTSLSFAATDSPKNFTVSSNTNWNISNSGTSWLIVSPTSGSDSRTVTVTASANTNNAARNANLTVSGTGVQSRTVGVSQSGTAPPSLSVSPSSLSFASNDSPKTFNITSNISWSVNNSAQWLTVTPLTGSGNGMVTVTATSNTNSAGRNVNLTVSGTGVSGTGVQKQNISVSQLGTAPSINIEMVEVLGGTFTMGCTSEQGDDCFPDEKPSHIVTLSTFYIGKYEVMQAQWKAVTGGNPSYFPKGDNYPVENVSWFEIVGTSGASMEINGIRYYENGFIYKLNQMTGKQYRLPTEAEWEFAARGGRNSLTYKYSGRSILRYVGWYWDNIPSKSPGNPGYGTQPVGRQSANELGIYDMSGNVWEWCSDWYSENYYGRSPQNNPTGPFADSYRVYRGGGCLDDAVHARVSNRNYTSPGLRGVSRGFRLASSSN